MGFGCVEVRMFLPGSSGPWHTVVSATVGLFTHAHRTHGLAWSALEIEMLACNVYPLQSHMRTVLLDLVKITFVRNKTPFIVIFGVRCAHAICPAQCDWAPTEAYVLQQSIDISECNSEAKKLPRNVKNRKAAHIRAHSIVFHIQFLLLHDGDDDVVSRWMPHCNNRRTKWEEDTTRQTTTRTV